MKNQIDVPSLAAAYKRLVLWFGAQLLMSPVMLVLMFMLDHGPVFFVLLVACLILSLATVVALVIYASRVALALGSNVGFLWGLALMMPYLNIVALLVLSGRAAGACRAHGIPVGFFGPVLDHSSTKQPSLQRT